MLAAMTGGDAYRVDAGASDVFDRLARETSAYTAWAWSATPRISMASRVH